MELKKVIVILYGKGKHELIASGIKEHLAGFSKDYDIVMVDDESFTPNYSAVFKRKFYTFCQRNANWLYSVYSRLSEKKALRIFNKQRRKNFKENLNYRKFEKLKKRISYVKNILMRYDPEAVVCMTPQALKLALAVKDIYEIDTKVVSFMADFGMDLRFLDLRCDKYFVANGEVRHKLTKYGISEDNIMITGVPYAVNLKEKLNKTECRAELNIANDYPLVVLSGGKYGSLKIIDDFNKIIESICQFNLIALTGGNKKLSALMKAIKISDKNKNIQILEQADMKKLLAAADILVTVPSTDIILNGLINNCAVIAINPLSMTEKSNFAYFKHSGIVKTARNAHYTSLYVTELLLENKERQKLHSAAKEYLTNINELDTDKILMLMEGKDDKAHCDVQAERIDRRE